MELKQLSSNLLPLTLNLWLCGCKALFAKLSSTPENRLRLRAELTLVNVNYLLSLYAWRETLRGGMPVVVPTTTKSTTGKRRRKSQNSDLDSRTVSVLCLVANKILLS